MRLKSNTKEFIEKAKLIHGDFYNYNETVYTFSSEKVKIICPTHGKFEQVPNAHLKGKGCKQCGDIRSGKWASRMPITTNPGRFVTKAIKKHNNKYKYLNMIYVTCNTPILITCPVHGDFEQTPRSHLKGRGCLKCALELYSGWSRSSFIKKCKNNKAILYITQLFNDEESFIKIGITSTTFKKRNVAKGKYKNRLLEIIENTPGEIWDLETMLHRKYKIYSYHPKIKFHGSTECFTLDVMNLF